MVKLKNNLKEEYFRKYESQKQRVTPKKEVKETRGVESEEKDV